MFNPVSTYRIQFNSQFTFDSLEEIIPYLKKLGIKTIYASPVFQAVPGSMHGYDVTDPQHINPEIGNLNQLRRIAARLREEGMSWIQDIVPNHMGFHTSNRWLMDVLEKGMGSFYSEFFDIDWQNQGRLMVPFLEAPLEEVIGKGNLKIIFENRQFVMECNGSQYPLNKRSVIDLFEQKADQPDILEHLNSDHSWLRQVADAQYYRLCYWMESNSQMNYRRFFTVNGLICLQMQKEEVFTEYHKLIAQLVEEGIFQGLRIDHIDGLYDPAGYLRKLRELCGDEVYIITEKILAAGEAIPADWPVQGNTGYDFLSVVNNLLTNTKSEAQLTAFYEKITGNKRPPEEQTFYKKEMILHKNMGGELENLYQLLISLELVEEKALTRVSPLLLKEVIGEFLVHCPVYRFYGETLPFEKEEKEALAEIFDLLRKKKETLVHAINILENILLKLPSKAHPKVNEKVIHFYRRCMQYSGPLMAKGVEDTLMYTYNRFIAHNDVGDSQTYFGIRTSEFHHFMQTRQANFPLSMNATSTHDTKRGEDARARLNVISDIPGEWIKAVKSWIKLNQHLKIGKAPDINDEYFIYQTLTGIYPMPGEGNAELETRLKEYFQKALREAKRHSEWSNPDTEYEEATARFIGDLLKPENAFLKNFEAFHKRIEDFGIINSLTQVLLRFTCPGVPDTYQGTELWDLSLVDPDNRRPVDYSLREKLNDKVANGKTGQVTWNNRHDGSIKIGLIQLLLKERQNDPELFEKGNYIPLKVEGTYKDLVVAFIRKYRGNCILVASATNFAAICPPDQMGNFNWKNTRIVLPKAFRHTWTNLLNKEDVPGEAAFPVSKIFQTLPLCILKSKANERTAGILLPVASLPSKFGIGDFGPEAMDFARFLVKSGNKYWQILPLSPISKESAYSPYSSFSSMAGNILLISPEKLADDGLLQPSELRRYEVEANDRVNYPAVEKAKKKLFGLAYSRFSKGDFPELERGFSDFCRKESFWLDDFAIYTVLRTRFAKPWTEWPDDFRKKQAVVIKETEISAVAEIKQVKWLQYIFARQWKQLRDFCNANDLLIFGDMPFYVSHDSADVWANTKIFNLDASGAIKGIAGVPPDYFSEIGQLWGMPTFKWDVLKKQEYDWWIKRLKKNLKYYDLLRFDHFRAFSEYWEVPGGEKSAVNGKWLPGPGKDFFDMLEKHLGNLPFVAEDLGDNMEAVYKLREQVSLPGMKVLQFAFGDNMNESVDAPHNHTRESIVYTGTHDNNTTLGWYSEELKDEDRRRLREYVGYRVSKANVNRAMIRVAYASVGKIAIIPMQDILGSGSKSRTNTPGTEKNNWQWRMPVNSYNDQLATKLKKWLRLYERI